MSGGGPELKWSGWKGLPPVAGSMSVIICRHYLLAEKRVKRLNARVRKANASDPEIVNWCFLAVTI